jgi:hypothetical protein
MFIYITSCIRIVVYLMYYFACVSPYSFCSFWTFANSGGSLCDAVEQHPVVDGCAAPIHIQIASGSHAGVLPFANICSEERLSRKFAKVQFLLLPLAHHPQPRRQAGEVIEQQAVDEDPAPADPPEQHAVGGVVEDAA